MDNTQQINTQEGGSKRTAIAIGVGIGVLVILLIIILLLIRSCVNGRTVVTELHESRLHRENVGGTASSYLYVGTEMQGTGIGYTVERDGDETEVKYGGNACYSNEQIKTDSKEYETSNTTQGGIYPGTVYKKFFYIENVGTESVYVRFIAELPAGLLDMLDSSVFADGEASGAIGNEACDSGEWKAPVIDRYTAENGEEWVRFIYVRNDVLHSGDMTYWSPWSTLQMNSLTSNEDIAKAIENGWIDENGEFSVKFTEQAIQARKFDSAEEAFYALDNPDED